MRYNISTQHMYQVGIQYESWGDCNKANTAWFKVLACNPEEAKAAAVLLFNQTYYGTFVCIRFCTKLL